MLLTFVKFVSKPLTSVFNVEFSLYNVSPCVATSITGSACYLYCAFLLPTRMPIVMPHSISFINDEGAGMGHDRFKHVQQ